VDSLARGEVEDVDLGGLGLRIKASWKTAREGEGKKGREGKRRTVSELMVFGTAMSSSSEQSSCDGRAVCANEQKFIVFTSRICRSHGCLRGSGGVSTGKTVLMEASSSSESFQTTSLLSFPSLQQKSDSELEIAKQKIAHGAWAPRSE
jgi:hypothetical protein